MWATTPGLCFILKRNLISNPKEWHLLFLRASIHCHSLWPQGPYFSLGNYSFSLSASPFSVCIVAVASIHFWDFRRKHLVVYSIPLTTGIHSLTILLNPGTVTGTSGKEKLYGSWKVMRLDSKNCWWLHGKVKKRQKQNWATERDKVLMTSVNLIQLCLRQITAILLCEPINSFYLIKPVFSLFMMTKFPK